MGSRAKLRASRAAARGDCTTTAGTTRLHYNNAALDKVLVGSSAKLRASRAAARSDCSWHTTAAAFEIIDTCGAAGLT